ncbi:MAG: ABC transporter permease [Rikenellaceae bacterium]|jgi:lipoprotein-releasing system permease protein|nr:ABC transporter permease [Rikenellaceae bacterium]
MRLSLFFAKRYLFSRKSHSVINLVSGISAFTVAIPVMAMVVLLSVFNGFDSLIRSMYQHFDPPILVTPVRGKVFDANTLDTAAIRALDGVTALSFSLEETALFGYRDRQQIGTMKGVDSLFSTVVPIREMIVRGEYALRFGDVDQAVMGQGVAYALSADPMLVEPLWVYMPRRGRSLTVLPVDLYRRAELFPSGVFALDGETDGRYVLVPLDFAQRLLEYDSRMVSSLAVGLAEGSDADRVREQIAEIAGDDFRVLTRLQQKQELYRLMQYEKWGIYLIILLVLIIASFSIIGSLVMIILDKKKDIQTLVTLGAGLPLIRRIFVREGLLISGLGTALGLVLGIGLCGLQQQFGWVGMGGTSFLIDAYPVQMRWTDLAGVIVSVSVVNYLICRLTVGAMIKNTKNS